MDALPTSYPVIKHYSHAYQMVRVTSELLGDDGAGKGGGGVGGWVEERTQGNIGGISLSVKELDLISTIHKGILYCIYLLICFSPFFL